MFIFMLMMIEHLEAVGVVLKYLCELCNGYTVVVENDKIIEYGAWAHPCWELNAFKNQKGPRQLEKIKRTSSIINYI